MGKICVLLPGHWSAIKGGAEYQAHLLAEYLTEATDHDVVYLAHSAAADATQNYQVVTFSRPSILKHRWFGKSVEAPSLYSALSEINPDLVIHMVASAYTGIAAYFCHRKRIPFMWYLASDADLDPVPNLGVRGPAKIFDRFVFSYGRSRARSVVAQTSLQARTWKEKFAGSSRVIANFHPPIKEPLVKSEQQLNIYWVANLKKLKRPELFLDIAQHCQDLCDVRFFIAGAAENSEWSDGILERAARLDNVEYLNQLSVEQVNQHLAAGHLLINTSEYEGLPNTFLQAWMREVPTITLGVDPDRVITELGLGAVCESIECLVKEVRYFAKDRTLLRKLGERAKEFADKQYSMTNAQKVADYVDDLLLQSEQHV